MKNILRRLTKGKCPIRDLGEKGGGTGFLFVFLILFFAVGIFWTFQRIILSQHRLASSHRDQTKALQYSDSGLDQVLSKIRNHEIILPLEWPPTGAISLPMTITIPVGKPTVIPSPTPTVVSLMAKQRIDLIRDAADNPVRDIEGNLKYQVEAVVEDVQATGSKSKFAMKRGIKAVFSIVNFARYAFFSVANDSKAGLNYAGPYHSNGALTLTGNCWWNNMKNGDGSTNLFYKDSYTSVVAGRFIYNPGTVKCWSQETAYNTGNGQAKASSDTAYNILVTTSCPQGTWIDGAHGGFVVNIPPINATQFRSVAHVVIDANEIATDKTFLLQGSGLSNTGTVTLSNNQIIDVGISSPLPVYGPGPVRVNLSALTKGWTDGPVSAGLITDYELGDGYLGPTSIIASQNYHAALDSEFGLIIFINGDAAIWGMLPMDTETSPVTNKKVTIVVTGNIQAIGDILVSQSSYAAGGVPSKDIDPNPLVDNPNNDAIALLMNGTNFFVNPWYREYGSFFVNPSIVSDTSPYGGEIRMDALFYLPNGVTGGQNGTPATSGKQVYRNETGKHKWIQWITYHGSVVARASLDKPSASIYRGYDPKLKDNVSPIIPAGTTVSSWQEDVSPPQMH